MKRFDRMDDPVSHTAAVTAAVSFFALVIVASLAAGIPRAGRSPAWWAAGLAAAFVLGSSLFSYFKPHSAWSAVPLVVSGVVLLVLLAWHAWGVASRGDLGRAHQPVVLAFAWVTWAGTKYHAWRKARSAGAAHNAAGARPSITPR